MPPTKYQAGRGLRQQGGRGRFGPWAGRPRPPLPPPAPIQFPLRARAAALMPSLMTLPLPPLGAPLAVAGDAWQVVWADDSAGADQATDGFARVSWPVFRGADGPVTSGQGFAQTVQRAELFAAVVAAGAARGPLRIVTDSQYVARSIAKLRAWPWPPEWRHADPWHLLWHAAKLGALAANWIPAHRPRPEPPLLSADGLRGKAAW